MDTATAASETPITTCDGGTVVFKSRKQRERFDRHMRPARNGKDFSRVIRQFTTGDIVLHHFFECDGRWLGFVIIIGPRGGERSDHGWWVLGDDPATMQLVAK